MKLKITRLALCYINCGKIYLLCLFSLLLILEAEAIEYILSPALINEFGVTIAGEDMQIGEDTAVPCWQFLLNLVIMQIFSVIDTLLNTLLFPANLIFAILGFRIVEKVNVLDNLNRDRIYAYIKANPGACFSEIVKYTDLNRGTVQYHTQILEIQNKIEVYKDGGKIRYFQNGSYYSEKEKKFLVTFQNITNQRIISEIINGKCNTNYTLSQEIGISKGTISWYVKNLKEIGVIKEIKRGRCVIYKINISYRKLIERYK